MGNPTGDCLSDEQLVELACGTSSRGWLDQAHAHAATCTRCAALLAEVGRMRAREPPDPTTVDARPPSLSLRPLAVGDRIARFVIEDELGAGGMGVVYLAHDPILDRRLAVKLVGDHRRSEQARLLREAQAMARIEHDNVVRVFEAGEFDGKVFIAMEVMEGGDLRQWIRRGEHSWRQTVELFAQAGRGLGAAHEHGLVHRDFKPANVLLDGNRARVSDFGAVGFIRGRDRPITGDAIVDEPAAGGVVTSIVGTPRYMAPEQARGDTPTAASDQYSFAVSLYEALTGEVPRSSAQCGSTTVAGVPRSVFRCLARALAPDPGARHPTMAAMVVVLEHALSRRARRTRALLVGGALVVGLGLGGILVPLPSPPCTSPEGELSGVWDAERRAELRSKLEDGRQLGDEEWSRIGRAIDDYAESWGHTRHEACLDTRVRAEVSESVLDRRMACLDERRIALEETLALLRDGRASGRELELVYELPDLAVCDDLSAVVSDVALPLTEEHREQVERAERARAQADLALIVGGVDPALESIDALLESTSWQPTQASLLAARARLLLGQRSRLALPAWRGAYEAAVRSRDTELQLLLEMAAVDHFIGTNELDDAGFWMSIVDARAKRKQGKPAVQQARMRASLARAEGHLAAARDELEAGIALAEASGSPKVLLDVLYGDLGGVEMEQGNTEQALAATERAVAAATEAYGAGSLRALRWRTNLVSMSLSRRDSSWVERELRAILAAAGSLQYETGASPLLAMVLRIEGRAREAYAIDQARAEWCMSSLGATHPQTLESLGSVARDLMLLGDTEGAEAMLERAVATPRDVPGVSVQLLADLSRARRDNGDLEGADDALSRADDVVAASPESRPRWEAALHQERGMLELARGRPRAAADAFRRALAATVGRAPPAHVAVARLGLARALRSDGHPEQARDEAQRALAGLADSGDGGSPLAREIRDFLGEQ